MADSHETTTPGAELTELLTPDGVKLSIRIWRPVGLIRGSLLMIHGGCEHGGRYDHLRSQFQGAGWLVILPDHRGHGLSGGNRTDVRTCQEYLDDLLMIQAKLCPGGRADALLGHSFGGLLALRLAEMTPSPQAIVLSAPLLRLLHPVPKWKRWVGHILLAIAPQTRFRTHINPRNMTRDSVFLEKRLADPLLLRSVTVRWFFAMQQELLLVWQNLDQVTCPVLILQGLADRTVDPTAMREFVLARGQQPTTCIEFPEHVHELLQESDWEQTATTILEWLNTQMPLSPQGSSSGA